MTAGAVRRIERAIWVCWAALLVVSLALVFRIQPDAGDRAFRLQGAIPERFGDWESQPGHLMPIVNPQLTATLKQIYDDTLSRTYVNRRTGRAVMLSIAYGSNQDHENQTHKPEVCYPSQGFTVDSLARRTFHVAGRDVPVTTLHAQLGSRSEYVSYWLVAGDRVVRGALGQNLERLRNALNGKLRGGLLFRISEIPDEAASTYAVQESFASELVAAATPDVRRRLGLGAP